MMRFDLLVTCIFLCLGLWEESLSQPTGLIADVSEANVVSMIYRIMENKNTKEESKDTKVESKNTKEGSKDTKVESKNTKVESKDTKEESKDSKVESKNTQELENEEIQTSSKPIPESTTTTPYTSSITTELIIPEVTSGPESGRVKYKKTVKPSFSTRHTSSSHFSDLTTTETVFDPGEDSRVDEDDDANEDAKDANELSEEDIDCETELDLTLLRNGLGTSGFLWEGGRVPYLVDEGFNATQKEIIKEAIAFYNKEFEGCIEWTPRSDEIVYVHFENSGICSSKVGVAYFPFPVYQSIYLGKCADFSGHVKHEMMHTLGFYHEHSRSDRDMFVDILWQNIEPRHQSQFNTYRWTTGYGEDYDYGSIMHYSSRAFVKDRSNKELNTLVPKDKSIKPADLGWKDSLSDIDKIKMRKMYKCEPFKEFKVECSSDENCGINEYCAPLLSQCRTKLPDGSICIYDNECIHRCGTGVCSECLEDSECGGEDRYCAYKYLPAVEKECSSICGSFCLFGFQCGGSCPTCTWGFICQ